VTTFTSARFDPARCATELDDLSRLLATRSRLEERGDLLPFFRERPHLTAFLGSYHPNLVAFDRVAYELRLFGSFVADIVVGDWERRAFCLIEFEDAAPGSVFARGRRATREWSPRFEHGFGQIVDWFWKIDDLVGTTALAEVFGADRIDASALLVAGREADLTPTEQARLEWRRRHVLVDSQRVYCCTFDELERDLRQRLPLYRWARTAE
jgi:hypothetical protein